MEEPEHMRRIGIEVRAVPGTGILHQLTGVIAQHEGDIESVELINGDPTDTLYFEIDMPGEPAWSARRRAPEDQPLFTAAEALQQFAGRTRG